MKLEGSISSLSKSVKWFIAAFVLVLNIGYFSGLLFVQQTDSTHPDGLVENYNGNEDLEEVKVMKFKKSSREMLTIIHTHILSMSFIFFLLGGVLSLTSLPSKLKTFLLVEPFVSILVTFGGIYLVWTGVFWMKYIVIFSGTLMTLCFGVSTLVILIQLKLFK